MILSIKNYENKITNAITRAKSAIASTRANPNIVIVKTSFLAAGFLPTAVIKAAKTLPIPIPAPITPITANPAPNYLSPSTSSIFTSLCSSSVSVKRR